MSSEFERVFNEATQGVLDDPGISDDYKRRYVVEVFKHLTSLGWEDLTSISLILNPIVYAAYEEFISGLQ